MKTYFKVNKKKDILKSQLNYIKHKMEALG